MAGPALHRDESFLCPSFSSSSSNVMSDSSLPMGAFHQAHPSIASHSASSVPPCHKESKSREPDIIDKMARAVLVVYHRIDKRIFYILSLLVYHAFWIFSIYQTWSKTPTYCKGVKLLTILTVLAYIVAIHKFLIAGRFDFCKTWLDRFSHRQQNILKLVAWIVFWLGVVAYFVSFAWLEVYRFQSAAGYFTFLVIGFICSKHRHAIKWTQICWGLAIQVTFGIVVLRTEIGKQVFKCIGEKVNNLLDCTMAGSQLIFGYLADGMLKGPAGNATILVNGSEYLVQLPVNGVKMSHQDAIFAFTSMPVVIFFSFFVSILYYFGVMQIVVRKLGWLLQVSIGTTACESISASGNIFLGMTESPLLVRPFLPMMTKSELHAVLVAGFATIAGSVMAAFINFGISAEHLLSSSVMAAPSALALSKLLYPETEVSRTSCEDIVMESRGERNAIEAGANGAAAAVKLVSNIVANLIAFMAFLAFTDQILGWLGDMVGLEQNLSFELILSKLFIPFALMLGIDWHECDKIASLIGLKMVVNEFVAYKKLGDLKHDGLLTLRSQTIVTYALCGFANFGSVGIAVGALSVMAPNRKAEIAELAFRAMLTGTMASFLTACLAGMLI